MHDPTITFRGQQWALTAPHRTSDGHVLATGFLLDDAGDRALDEDGYPVIHQFYLGVIAEERSVR